MGGTIVATLRAVQGLTNSVGRVQAVLAAADGEDIDEAALAAAAAPLLADLLAPRVVEAIGALSQTTPDAVEAAVRAVFADAGQAG